MITHLAARTEATVSGALVENSSGVPYNNYFALCL